MKFNDILTPNQLLHFLDKNIQYGVVDKFGNKVLDSNSKNFQYICNNDWKLKTVNDIIKSGIGHCYDQVEIEREWFEAHNYIYKTFWVSAYQDDIENSGFSHAYLVYFDKNSWHLFEHADFSNKGIHKFNTLKEALDFQSTNQIKYASSQIKPKDKYSIFIKEFKKPPINANMEKYLSFIFNS